MTHHLNPNYIRTRRHELGISLHAAARHLNCGTATIRTYETTSHHPHLTLHRLHQLAALLNTHPTQLLAPTPTTNTTGDSPENRTPDPARVDVRIPLGDPTLTNLWAALNGALTPAGGNNPHVHLHHLARIGVIDHDHPQRRYRVNEVVTHALDRPPDTWHTLHTPQRPAATWRTELLAAVDDLESAGRHTFTPGEIARQAVANGSTYKLSTLRQRVTQHLATPIADPARDLYTDLQRTGPGTYRRSSTAHPDTPPNRSAP